METENYQFPLTFGGGIQRFKHAIQRALRAIDAAMAANAINAAQQAQATLAPSYFEVDAGGGDTGIQAIEDYGRALRKRERRLHI